VTGLLLFDPHGHDPTPVESLTVDDTGIGVVRSRGHDPRVLPWDAMLAQAVEPWSGGIVPEWWDAPGPDGPGTVRVDSSGHLDPGTGTGDLLTTGRVLPYAEAGAMISIQTRTGTYRFLRPGADPSEVAGRLAEFAIRHRGSAGVSSVTTVAPKRHRRDRASSRSTWARLRPWLVVLLIVLIAAAVTVILLQSAGEIHLPFLGSGGSSSGLPAP
jgi:hypothetical protein